LSSRVGWQKVVIDGVLVGGIWVEEFAEYHRLREIQLWPDFRNKGYGTSLVEIEIQRAEDVKKELRLRVLLQNPAVELYKRLGLIVTETIAGQYHMVSRPKVTIN
jgi:GNAT superfamily N-acetyltransferase